MMVRWQMLVSTQGGEERRGALQGSALLLTISRWEPPNNSSCECKCE